MIFSLTLPSTKGPSMYTPSPVWALLWSSSYVAPSVLLDCTQSTGQKTQPGIFLAEQ